MTIPFYRFLEVGLYSLLNLMPFLLLAIFPFRRHLRFPRPVTAALIVGMAVFQIGLGYLTAFGQVSSEVMSLVSIFIYAGSMQYLAADLLTGGAGLITAALTTLMVNARHLFYGISMVDTYKNAGAKKPHHKKHHHRKGHGKPNRPEGTPEVKPQAEAAEAAPKAPAAKAAPAAKPPCGRLCACCAAIRSLMPWILMPSPLTVVKNSLRPGAGVNASCLPLPFIISAIS